jgi:DNA primase
MNKNRASVLKSRQVLILPDADKAGREGAQVTLHLLHQLLIAAQIKELFPQQDDHTDIADHLVLLLQGECTRVNSLPDRSLPLAHPLPQEKVESIKVLFGKHPVLWQLTDQLGLEISDTKIVSKL